MMETALDFYILKDTNPNKIVIIDLSTYLESPESPILSITFPGFKNPIDLPFNFRETNILNTSMLGMSALGNFANFGDGVYKFTYSICPNDQLQITHYHLIDTSFKEAYNNKLISYLLENCGCMDKEIENKLNEIDLFIEAAHIEAKNNKPISATKFYNKANYLVSKLKCI